MKWCVFGLTKIFSRNTNEIAYNSVLVVLCTVLPYNDRIHRVECSHWFSTIAKYFDKISPAMLHTMRYFNVPAYLCSTDAHTHTHIQTPKSIVFCVRVVDLWPNFKMCWYPMNWAKLSFSGKINSLETSFCHSLSNQHWIIDVFRFLKRVCRWRNYPRWTNLHIGYVGISVYKSHWLLTVRLSKHSSIREKKEPSGNCHYVMLSIDESIHLSAI